MAKRALISGTDYSFVLVDTAGMSKEAIRQHARDCHDEIRRLREITEMLVDGMQSIDELARRIGCS